MSKTYVGDYGTVFTVNCGEDISAATVTQINIKKPGGSEIDWTASIYGTNYLQYTIQDGDLDESGVYKVQAALTLPSWKGLGETDTFTVYEAYE